MRNWSFLWFLYFAFILRIEALAIHRTDQHTERISRSAGDVLEDDPIGRLKVFVYELPSKYNKKIIYMHRFLLSSPVRILNPEEADWFYTPVYTTCEYLTPHGHPLPFNSPRMMRSAILLIASRWPYWNRTHHFFIVPHDFWRIGILPLLQRATLVQTFGQQNHVCLKDGSITIPPYAPPQKVQSHLIPPATTRFYFRGLFYDNRNEPGGGYYARGARAAYEDMQRAIFCLCPLGWAPWSPRLVEAVEFRYIGLFVAEKDVLYLDNILTPVPPEEILRKQRLLANPSMKQEMLFLQPAQRDDNVLNRTAGPVGDLKPWKDELHLQIFHFSP
ncbi:unnamed protein product [Withania somnifera]